MTIMTALAVAGVGVGLGLGVAHTRISGTEALFTSMAPTQDNSLTAQTCLEDGQHNPPGAHLKPCPPTPDPPKPKPAPKCENVLDSQSPASAAKSPIGTLPVTLSATYHDESPMNSTDKPPTLSINGDDQPGAWGTSLTVSDDSSDKDGYQTTVSYTVPSNDGDGKLYKFVITFYDTDKSLGCGVATFYVQSPPATAPAVTSCHEDVLDSFSPDSSASDPMTSLTTLSAVYHDETPMNTSSDPPSVTIDGNNQAGAWGSSLTVTADDHPTPHDYWTTVSYTVPNIYGDGQLHTFVITFYDSEHGSYDGCGVATFYVKAPTP
jgi:hypothetical protein